MATDVLLIAEARIATVQLLEQLLSHLQENTPLRAQSRLLSELQATDLGPGTYPLIVRSCAPEAHGLANVLRRHGVPYGFYLDDNFWLIDRETELGRYYARRPQRRRLEAIVRNASTVIAATPLLRDYLQPYSENVVQLDSFFDFSFIPELPPHSSNRSIVRGGFAASADRMQDLRPVIREVLDVLDEHENVEFEVIGVDGADLPSHPRIRAFPYRDSYADYIAFQQSRDWDFGLAPLGASPSNLYKTDNKFREYAAQGIPGVYQDAPPYRSVRDGETGLLVGASRSWRDAIHDYVVDPALRSRVRRDARLDAEQRCALENVAPRWQQFFDSAPGMGATPEQVDRVRRVLIIRSSRAGRALQRVRSLWAFGWTQVEQYGFLPTVARTGRFLRGRAVSR